MAVNLVATLAILLAISLFWMPAAFAGPQPAPWRATTNVSMVDNVFQPQPVNIQVGDTVFWTNNGILTHTATSDTGIWNSGFRSPGQTFSFTFNTAGTFSYRCTIHSSLGMVGTVIVQGAGQATATVSATATGTTTATATATGTATATATPATPTATGTPTTPTATGTAAPRTGLPTILISAVDNRFMPQNISVSTGASLVWTNNGTVPHTVTSDTGLWDSGSLAPGQTFSRFFDAPGTYYYHCNFHQGAGMVGVITVTGLALATATATPSTGTATPTPTATPEPSIATPTPTPAQPVPAPTPLPPGVTPFPSTLPATGEASFLPWAVLAAAGLFLAGLVARVLTRR